MRRLILMAAILAVGTAWADDAPQKEAQRLVKQLGSREVKERLAAERRLLALGREAVEAVKEGRTSDSEQVADRCDRLIVRLREAGHDQPAWKEFAKLCGDNATARAWYTAMLKTNEMNYWLEKIDDDPAAAEGAYQEALDGLMKWNSRFTEDQRRWHRYPYQQAAFLLFVGGMDAATKVKGPKKDVPAKEYQDAIRAVLF